MRQTQIGKIVLGLMIVSSGCRSQDTETAPPPAQPVQPAQVAPSPPPPASPASASSQAVTFHGTTYSNPKGSTAGRVIWTGEPLEGSRFQLVEYQDLTSKPYEVMSRHQEWRSSPTQPWEKHGWSETYYHDGRTQRGVSNPTNTLEIGRS
jgi:hypothetical protein